MQNRERDMRERNAADPQATAGKLLKRSGEGILNDNRPRLFEEACKMGLEGLVSKHRERTYRAGRSPHWIKVKNPKSSATVRAKDGPW
jgi:hypothetical protein